MKHSLMLVVFFVLLTSCNKDMKHRYTLYFNIDNEVCEGTVSIYVDSKTKQLPLHVVDTAKTYIIENRLSNKYIEDCDIKIHDLFFTEHRYLGEI